MANTTKKVFDKRVLLWKNHVLLRDRYVLQNEKSVAYEEITPTEASLIAAFRKMLAEDVVEIKVDSEEEARAREEKRRDIDRQVEKIAALKGFIAAPKL